MSSSDIAEGSRVVVAMPYDAQYSDPISFRAGEHVHVGRADPDYPAWFWCRGPGAKEGWVHESLLSGCERIATALKEYSARELNVRAGDSGRVVHMLGGWAYLQLDDGRVGWVPERVIEST
jgi:SH3-like domain-containing protein